MSVGARACSILAALLLSLPAVAQELSWMRDRSLVTAAQREGQVTIFSSINEEEELPVLQVFRDATGIRFDYIRGNDATLMSRITIEARAGKQSWDVASTRIESMPKDFVLAFEPPLAKDLQPSARDPEGRWFGAYAIIFAPAYNSTKLRAADLPKTYEEFAQRKDLVGRVAIEATDRDWMAGMFEVYGEARGRKLMQDIATNLKPPVHTGHLAMARALGAGEYAAVITNYLSLTLTAQLAGDPVEFWVLDPVLVGYGEIGANARAPHPNAARLLVNYYLSAETQKLRTRWGRVPTRDDVPMHPAGVLERFAGHKIVRTGLPPEEAGRWQKSFNELFKQP